MNLAKAIRLKKHYQYILQDASLPELIEADSLSIQALEREKEHRELDIDTRFGLLPGETEE